MSILHSRIREPVLVMSFGNKPDNNFASNAVGYLKKQKQTHCVKYTSTYVHVWTKSMNKNKSQMQLLSICKL